MHRSALCLLALMVPCVMADGIPANALRYLPALVSTQQTIWPDAPMPSFLAAQIEQESCITQTHSRCWNPRAELKTPRENGIGFGQFTRAYRADGSIRFDTISELAATHKSLHGWSWQKRYDAHYQLAAIVEMDRALYLRQRDTASKRDRLSFTLAAYNGGPAGVLQDRRLCANTRGCDPSRWWGHVERTSLKSKTPAKGYGQSFFQINREYVSNILNVRRQKYEPYFQGDAQ